MGKVVIDGKVSKEAWLLDKLLRQKGMVGIDYTSCSEMVINSRYFKSIPIAKDYSGPAKRLITVREGNPHEAELKKLLEIDLKIEGPVAYVTGDITIPDISKKLNIILNRVGNIGFYFECINKKYYINSEYFEVVNDELVIKEVYRNNITA